MTPGQITHVFPLHVTDHDGTVYTVELRDGKLIYSHPQEVFWLNVARILAGEKEPAPAEGMEAELSALRAEHARYITEEHDRERHLLHGINREMADLRATVARIEWQRDDQRHDLMVRGDAYMEECDRLKLRIQELEDQTCNAEELRQTRADHDALRAQLAATEKERDAFKAKLTEVEKEFDDSRASQRAFIIELQDAMVAVFRHLSPPTKQFTPWRQQVIKQIDAIRAEREAARTQVQAMMGVIGAAGASTSRRDRWTIPRRTGARLCCAR